MKRKYMPVRYIDRVIKLNYRLRRLRVEFEEYDPEVAMLVEQVERKLSHAMMMINRDGPDRDQYRKACDTIEISPFYEGWIAGGHSAKLQ